MTRAPLVTCPSCGHTAEWHGIKTGACQYVVPARAKRPRKLGDTLLGWVKCDCPGDTLKGRPA